MSIFWKEKTERINNIHNAAATVAVGDCLIIEADGDAAIADADAGAVGLEPAHGMAGNASTDQNPVEIVTKGILCKTDATWTVGGLFYLTVTGTTGNTISQTSPGGTDEQIIGVAINATDIKVDFTSLRKQTRD